MMRFVRIFVLTFDLIIICFFHEIYGAKKKDPVTQESLQRINLQLLFFGLGALGLSNKDSCFENLLEALKAAGNNTSEALIYAAIKGYSNIIQTLIKLGADPNYRYNGRYSPLYYAADLGHKDVIRELLQYPASMDVVNIGSPRRLLEFEALVGALASTPHRKLNNRLYTPLHCAVKNGDLETVRMLSGNRRLYGMAKAGMTPLNLAIRYGNVPIVFELFLGRANRFGKVKTSIELEESKRRIITRLLVFECLKMPTDIIRLLVSYMPEDVYNHQMFLEIIPYIQDKKAMRQLLKSCPRSWTEQALQKFSGKLRARILGAVSSNIKHQVTAFCKRKDASGRTYHDIIQTLRFDGQADGERIRSELSTIFNPFDPENKRKDLISVYVEETYKKRTFQ
jgi:Ankyrin repeats (3 copies)